MEVLLFSVSRPPISFSGDALSLHTGVLVFRRRFQLLDHPRDTPGGGFETHVRSGLSFPW